MPSPLLPILLVTHITLAILLFLPSILLPFALRTRRATVDSDSRVVRGLLWGQSHGTMIIGAGLRLVTGAWRPARLDGILRRFPSAFVARCCASRP